MYEDNKLVWKLSLGSFDLVLVTHIYITIKPPHCDTDMILNVINNKSVRHALSLQEF